MVKGSGPNLLTYLNWTLDTGLQSEPSHVNLTNLLRQGSSHGVVSAGYFCHSLQLKCMVVDLPTHQLHPGPWEIRWHNYAINISSNTAFKSSYYSSPAYFYFCNLRTILLLIIHLKPGICTRLRRCCFPGFSLKILRYWVQALRPRVRTWRQV